MDGYRNVPGHLLHSPGHRVCLRPSPSMVYEGGQPERQFLHGRRPFRGSGPGHGLQVLWDRGGGTGRLRSLSSIAGYGSLILITSQKVQAGLSALRKAKSVIFAFLTNQ